MKLPFKPHLLVLLCSAGLFAASGVMFVKSRATEPAPAPAPVAPQLPDPAAQPAPVATCLYRRADRSVDRAHCALPRRAAVANSDGLNLSGERDSGRPVVKGQP